MQDLKDLKRCFSRVRSRGTGPRATVVKAASLARRARACPSPCLDREGNALVCVRFSRESDDRRGQAPALRAGKGFFSPCPVREQVLPKLQSPAPLLLILEILQILILSDELAINSAAPPC